MRAIELMSRNPATCTPDTDIERAAHLMETHDCGLLPVVDNGSVVSSASLPIATSRSGPWATASFPSLTWAT